MKTHEINIGTSKAWNDFQNQNYMIMELNDIQKDDFILFKQTENVDGEIKETGSFRMTQVSEIIENDGLKDGYDLVVLKKL